MRQNVFAVKTYVGHGRSLSVRNYVRKNYTTGSNIKVISVMSRYFVLVVHIYLHSQDYHADKLSYYPVRSAKSPPTPNRVREGFGLSARINTDTHA